MIGMHGNFKVYNDINHDNFEDLQQQYFEADLRVLVPVNSPDMAEVRQIETVAQSLDNITVESITLDISNIFGINNSDIASKLLSGIMNVAPSKSAIRSAYIKELYWLKTVYRGRLLGGYNIYYSAPIDKYMTQVLYLLSTVGNNVTIVDCDYTQSKYKGTEGYFSISNKLEKLQLDTKPKRSFDDILKILRIEDEKETEKFIKEAGATFIVHTDKEGKLRQALQECFRANRNWVKFYDGGLQNPSYQEVARVPRPDAKSIDSLLSRIGPHMFAKKANLSNKAAEYIKKTIAVESNLNKAINTLIEFICIYNRENTDIKLAIFLGNFGRTEEIYAGFLLSIGIEIIVVDTEGTQRHDSNIFNVIELDTAETYRRLDSRGYETVGFRAEQEIGRVLYNGDTPGLYRDRQFSTCSIVELKTTIDEMLVYWDAEMMLRPSFESDGQSVKSPVFMSILSGVGSDYTQTINKLVTRHTIQVRGVENVTANKKDTMIINHSAVINNTTFSEQKPIYKNGKIDIDTIVGYKTFTYRHLDTGVQFHILSKIKELVENKLIRHPEISDDKFVDLVLNIGLNLSDAIQQELQWYDFTKKSPKMVVISTGTEILDLEGSILIELLHLMGWDIAFVVPTGYNIVGNNLRPESLQKHILGEPNFNMAIPELRPLENETKAEKKGLFSRLFG